MRTLENNIRILQFTMNKPDMYGVFHIMSLISVILLSIILIKHAKNKKKTIFIMSSIMLMFEVYKQLSFSYNDFSWSYSWYAFPYQFCSTPMYVGFLYSLIKNKKVSEYLECFLMTYALSAGVCVMLYPSTVFVREAMINIQTMIHHGFMVVMGLYLLFKENNIKHIYNKAFTVFFLLSSIAIISNIITYYVGIDNGLELFYISPFHNSTLPIFSIIDEHAPYIVFIISYYLIFSIGSMLPIGIKRLFQKFDNNLKEC